MSVRTEDLIAQVQHRPCIWNVNVEDYYNRVHKQRVWHDLAQVMYKDWQHLKKDIKIKRVQCLKKKWKGLRTYYFREKTKNLSSSDTVPKKRSTPLWDKLQFLSVVNRDMQKDDISALKAASKKRQEEPLPSKPKEMPNFQKVFLKSMEKSRDDDPDKSFLLSLLPDMKSMNPGQNLNFRFEVMKIIKQIKYNENIIEVKIKHEPPTEYEFYVETPAEFQN